jgi:hypothetical protein
MGKPTSSFTPENPGWMGVVEVVSISIFAVVWAEAVVQAAHASMRLKE